MRTCLLCLLYLSVDKYEKYRSVELGDQLDEHMPALALLVNVNQQRFTVERQQLDRYGLQSEIEINCKKFRK